MSGMDHSANGTAHSDRRQPRRSPLASILVLFTSVRLGIVTLTLLFIYSWIGSAGIWYPIHPNLLHADSWVHAQIRTWRPFEMTEFEWFHWWPFDVLIALLCVNLVVATIRRIPFNVINLGVWMIHTGIVTLCLASVWYFATKIEGDAPVIRRAVVIEAPGHAPVRLPALPGNSISVGEGDSRWAFEIAETDPQWELLTGADKGRRVYSVSVRVTPPAPVTVGATAPAATSFVRQLIADRPEYTEDIIPSGDPAQPFKRARKVLGDDRPILDEALRLSLELEPQHHFYVVGSSALYLRERGAREWVERPIRNLPRYNDYIDDSSDVWSPSPPPVDALRLTVPSVEPDDPLAGVDLHITGFLRYADLRQQVVALPAPQGSGLLNPYVGLRLVGSGGERNDYALLAHDPARSTAEEGAIAFRTIANAADLDALAKPPTLTFTWPAAGIDNLEVPITRFPARGEPPIWTALATAPDGRTLDYAVRSVAGDLLLTDGKVHHVAFVDLRERSPDGVERRITRWAFADSTLTRDVEGPDDADAHGAGRLILDDLTVGYRPGRGRASLSIVAGPGEKDLAVIVAVSGGESRIDRFPVGQAVRFDESLSYQVMEFLPQSTVEFRPYLVPPAQRDRDADLEGFYSTVELHPPQGAVEIARGSNWLRFHKYPFANQGESLMRYPFEPSTFRLADGREIEVLFSRERSPLPAPVVLDDFKLTAHVGGYTGEQGSIRDWTSVISFLASEGKTISESVSVNDPVSWGGYAYFQAFWDAPIAPRGPAEPGSRGMNYTVLGVGNREGVIAQLAASMLAVIGMIYAFYVKPAIKRRRRANVLAAIASSSSSSQPRRRAATADLARERA